MLIDSTSAENKSSSGARESVSSKVHQCTRCNYNTISTMHLKRHMVTHSHIPDNNRIDRRCIYCNTTFAHKISLDDHIHRLVGKSTSVRSALIKLFSPVI
ncbi:unnamed protein product [Callosobruchus maculatus]|uniref:C2H2-type domain-containing protein n=1 Tax=Callosobruchus maculatus TaxID=64391 RepID=A0A653D9C2_CALMS|nr:unnamed protein product [Callosobruchus maculatus]